MSQVDGGGDKHGECHCGKVIRPGYGPCNRTDCPVPDQAQRPPTAATDAELAAYKTAFDGAFAVVLNANDFYGYACADATQIQAPGFPALLRLAREFGNDGVNAAMATAAQCEPIKPYLTKKFKAAMSSITPDEREALAEPDFCSDWAEVHAKLAKATEALSARSASAAPLPEVPPLSLLVSMALRVNHGFGLDDERSQQVQLDDMKKVYEEVSGHGFYRQERTEYYRGMVKGSEVSAVTESAQQSQFGPEGEGTARDP